MNADEHFASDAPEITSPQNLGQLSPSAGAMHVPQMLSHIDSSSPDGVALCDGVEDDGELETPGSVLETPASEPAWDSESPPHAARRRLRTSARTLRGVCDARSRALRSPGA